MTGPKDESDEKNPMTEHSSVNTLDVWRLSTLVLQPSTNLQNSYFSCVWNEAEMQRLRVHKSVNSAVNHIQQSVRYRAQ